MYDIQTVNAALPTLYEYYTSGGVTTGLNANSPNFTLNDRYITLYSGAMHYFRVPKQYWRDRLRKMRAAGLNTVETYIPWNLHEPEPGNFDFGEGSSDMTDFLDVKQFLEIAKEEDLFAIVRPGPYICSEWEFGGLPSWLLRDPNIIVRTSQNNFMKHVERFFNAILKILALLQFTNGGPIIAFQIENEYGSTNQPGVFTPDKLYLEQLRQLMINNGIKELLFTSDSPTASGTLGTLPEYFLQTANFGGDPETEFDKLKQLQPNKPTMAMEYWGGWFDHWTETHHTVSTSSFNDTYERILKYPASVNIYMFHGGTNWGFLNGANIGGPSTDNAEFQPDTTSYDYDAPLTEAGDYTEKYVVVKNLIAKYNTVLTRLPNAPSVTLRKRFSDITSMSYLSFKEVSEQISFVHQSKNLISMENMPTNNGTGQSYGYIIYRKENLNLTANSILKIGGRVCDTVMVLLNGKLVSKPLTQSSDLNEFGYWRVKDSQMVLTTDDVIDGTLELVVENWGRNNFGKISQFQQYKGLWQGGVFINEFEIFDWKIQSLEFKKSWTTGLSGWHSFDQFSGPGLYKFELNVDVPQDTFINMSKWSKGVVIVNGFVLGRHLFLGPQQTLYFPGPLMKTGLNEIIVFEHFYPSNSLEFSENPIFNTLKTQRRPVVIQL